MTATCPVCYGQSDDGTLCTRCTNSLVTDLRGNAVVMGVAELVDNLHVAQAKLARGGEQLGGGSIKHERLPLNLGAMEAVRKLEFFLGAWAMDVTGEAWWPVQGRYVAVEAAEQLLTEENLAIIRKHGAVKELVEEITKAIDHARNLLDVEPFTRFPVGPCPEDGCKRTVFALCPAEDSTRPAMMACYLMAQTENRPDLGAGFVHSWNSAQFFRAGTRIRRKMEQAKGAA